MDLRRWQKALDWLVCLYILSYAVCLLLAREQGWILSDWGILFPASALIISLAAIGNTCLHTSGRDRNFWLFLSLGMAASLAGMLVWGHQVSSPGAMAGLTELPLWLLAAGAVGDAGAVGFLLIRPGTWERFRYGVEMFIVMAVAAALSWSYLVRPALENIPPPGFNHAVAVGYSLLSLLLLLAALGIIYAPRRDLPGSVWPWLTFHLLMLVVSNSAYIHLALQNPLQAGILVQPLQALAYLFLVPAAVNYLEYCLLANEEGRAAPARASRPAYLQLLLPYAFLGALLIIMFSSIQEITSLHIVGLSLLLLVFFRQVYILTGHSHRLARVLNQTGELELEAKSRAEELARKNDQLQQVLDDIQHMAYYDALTNLPNRRMFMKKISESLIRARNNNHMLAILFIDLDNFKLINDTMGHSFGDLFLKELGIKIKNSIRENDVVSRQGGDEFAVLLDEISSIDEAKQWIEEIQKRIQDGFVINQIEVHIAASIGVAIYPRHGEDIDNLIKYSDIAMYKAKELGRNQYAIYTADMNHVFVRRMSLDKELRSAIQNEEFSLYYQPQINITSGTIIGIEALVRWNNLALGEVTPSELIPVAEENGHIMQIGEWVLTTACRQCRSWLEEGYVIPKIAVNISPVQFNDEKLVESVKRILRETGLDPHYLELEITEGIAMYNERAVINKLQALKELGISVALDDFGTGYSCLAYLSQFPVDTLKIDRRFIRNINTDSDSEILVETIIVMAHNFNINVVAEGVDTLEQFQLLRAKKCDEIQGYLISEPVGSAQIVRILEQYSDKTSRIRAIR